MNRVGVRLVRGPDDFRRVEVRRDLDGRVRRARVQRSGVVGRGDGDGLDAERAACAKDAQRDLATVGDQQAAHGAGDSTHADVGS
jgi:hypothetical protein